MEHRFTSLPPDPFMCSSDEKQSRSPLALYSEYQRMDIELRPPHAMPTPQPLARPGGGQRAVRWRRRVFD